MTKAILTEEVFARIAAHKPNLADRFKALTGWIRDWLRRHTRRGITGFQRRGSDDFDNLVRSIETFVANTRASAPWTDPRTVRLPAD
jgi:hypothetical protein